MTSTSSDSQQGHACTCITLYYMSNFTIHQIGKPLPTDTFLYKLNIILIHLEN